jgi:hypothetical protein
MKKFAMLVTFLGLLIAGVTASALETEWQLAINRVADPCLRTKWNKEIYNQSVAAGNSQGDATTSASGNPKFEKVVYDQAIAAGKSDLVAKVLSTTYEYADNSKFCRQFRGDLRFELSNLK